jgi:hypothetical protein
VPLDDALRAHRLARGDIVLHDDAEHFQTAFRDHANRLLSSLRHPRIELGRTSNELALEDPEC